MYERGRTLDPKNAAFALGLARIETQEKHLDRAEAVLRQAYAAHRTVDLAFGLADCLISQDKIQGAEEYITLLATYSLGDTLGALLKARILFKQEKWAEAIPRLEAARESLKSDARFGDCLNLMLADCYGNVFDEERRLATLRRVAEGGQGPKAAVGELVASLARSGRLDQAVTILSPMAGSKPEWRLDLVQLLIEKTSRLPRGKRNWREVEQQLAEAEKALPRSGERLLLAHVNILVAEDRLEDARALVSTALAKEPRNLRYRLLLARLNQRQGKSAVALQVIDQAEKELGPSLELRLARLAYWGQEGGAAAKAAVAEMAEVRDQVPLTDRPLFLERLANVETRLGEPALARQHTRELATLRPADVRAKMALFDMAKQSGDQAEADGIIAGIRAIEGERGTHWRLLQAFDLLDQARRDATKDLKVPKDIAAQLGDERPDWWGTAVIRAEIAELEGNVEEAIRNCTLAIELGNSQPVLAQRLLGLLAQRNDFDQVDHIINLLSNRGMAVGDLTIAVALEAIRRKEFDRGIALARQVFSESSKLYSDHLFLAQVYGAAGRHSEAGKELSKAVELGPTVPLTWVRYIDYLVAEKRIDEARVTIERARKSIPADRAKLTLAQCFWLVGEQTQAETLVEAALQSPACDPATIQAAVDFYTRQGRFDRIEPILDRLNASTMKTTPRIVAWANRERAMVRVRTGRLTEMDRALKLIDENLKADPSSAEDISLRAHLLAMRTSRRGDAIKLLEPIDQAKRLGNTEQFLLAQAYLSERLVDKYRAEMEKILGADVKNPQHLAHFIDFLIDRKELDRADRWLVELRHAAPRSLALLERQARVLALRERKPQLLELLMARGRRAPDDMGAVATLLERFGFANEAEEAYKAFVARNPKEPDRVLLMASFLARQNRTKEAVVILDKARVTCRPDAVARTALFLYGAPSGDNALRSQVEKWVAEAIRTSPSTTLALRPRLATIYVMQARYDEAESLLRQVLVNEPDHVDALNALAWLLAFRQNGESREALEMIDRAIEKGGLASSLVDTRAVVLIRSGEPARATQQLLAAQEADPRNVSLALHLAWAYQVDGKITAAREQFQRAQEFGLKREERDPLERVVIDGLQKTLTTDQAPHPRNG